MAVIATSSLCLPSPLPFSVPFVSMTHPSAAATAAAAARRTCLINGGVAAGRSSPSSASTLKPIRPPKRLLLLRHGQAAHNPRAEHARENGCSFEEFLRLMEEDDEYDAALTKLGEHQAKEAGRRRLIQHALRDVDMIVSSPLSRALKTADLISPPIPHNPPHAQSLSAATFSSPFEGEGKGAPRRICVEEFREINGRLLNAKRRPRFELERSFPHWDFSLIPPNDETWTADQYESSDECAERGYRGLLWLMDQRERRILVTCHGGLLSYTMNDNCKVILLDGRDPNDDGKRTLSRRCTTKRFGNCEMREFDVTVWALGDDDAAKNGEIEPLDGSNKGVNSQLLITLEEVSMQVFVTCSMTDSEV